MSYDFIVAGSGAGGSAVAALLAEAGARILLVEKGEKAEPPQDAMEAVYRYYTSSGFLSAAGNCLIPVPTGTALGGTTKINSGTCLRTPDELLRRWERGGRGTFRREGFLPYLDAAWRRLGAARAPEATMSPSSRLFLEGLERLSVPGGHLLERAESGCRGLGRCCFVCPTDAKMSADRAFLEGAKRSLGFTLAAATELAGIEPPGRGREITVRLRRGGKSETAAARTLILAAGALATPYLIRRFRLGPSWRQAGDGLSLHPAAKVFASFDDPVLGWSGVPQGAGLLDPFEPRIRYEGVYTPPEIAALTLPLEGLRLRRWMDRYDRVATFGYMIKDSSRGRVRYPLGRAAPLIRYDMSPEDLSLMLAAMRFLGRVFFAAGAREVVLPLNRRENVFDTPAALARADFSGVLARDLQMMAFHPLGTAAMGRVVDENLRLCEGIYVCDGSVVPESLGVNPQVTIYAFALRLADHLLGRARAG